MGTRIPRSILIHYLLAVDICNSISTTNNCIKFIFQLYLNHGLVYILSVLKQTGAVLKSLPSKIKVTCCVLNAILIADRKLLKY